MDSDDRLLMKARAHLRTPSNGKNSVQQVLDGLAVIDGFDEIPTPLREEIEDYIAGLYGDAFIKGALWNERSRS